MPVLTAISVKEVATDYQATSKFTEALNSSLDVGRLGKQARNYIIYDQHNKTGFSDMLMGITFVAMSFTYILYMNFHQ